MLDLSPPYQRKSGIWNTKDKAYLIDSIINGFDMPKFYIADFSYYSSELNKSGKMYAVIDGRQRFEAIFDFMDGSLKLDKDFIYFADPSVKIAGLNAVEINNRYPKIFKRFESFNLSAMAVLTNREGRINELFIRLNKSKPLTGSEVRSAIVSEAGRVIKEAAAHKFFTNNVDFSNLRKQHENAAAKIVLFEHRGGFVETKKVNLDRFVLQAVSAEKDFKEIENTVKRNLDLLAKRFDVKDDLLKNSGVIPVYYWLVRNNQKINDIRDRIESFEVLKKTDLSNPDIISYINASRSTNDEHSYRVRYLILDRFVKTGLLDNYYDF